VRVDSRRGECEWLNCCDCCDCCAQDEEARQEPKREQKELKCAWQQLKKEQLKFKPEKESQQHKKKRKPVAAAAAAGSEGHELSDQ